MIKLFLAQPLGLQWLETTAALLFLMLGASKLWLLALWVAANVNAWCHRPVTLEERRDLRRWY